MAELPKTDSDNNIKILSVVWYKVLPPKFGGQKAVALFNEKLAQHAELICLCSKNNEAISAGYDMYALLPTSKLQFINPFVWRKVYRFAKKHHITHLVLEFPYHGIAGFICKKLLNTKLVVNTHNIEFKRFKENKKWWWGLLYHFEKWTLKNADAVFFKTKEDEEIGVGQFKLDQQCGSVIPYGTNEPKSFSKVEAQATVRQKHRIQQDEYVLLFAGTLDYAPNAAAVLAIAGKVIPLLDQHSFRYKIIVCGRNRLRQYYFLNLLKSTTLILTGEVEDIDLYFRAADIFINPVLGGGGIQTKIIDALSYHLNVVCFDSKRCNIENAGNKIYSAPDQNWNVFVSAILAACQTYEATPAAFFQTYNWRTIAAKAYKKILDC